MTNILFLMCDQMQAQVLRDRKLRMTPHLDALAAQGMLFTRAYTPNAVCSPARASLMTGLLPHNHGVIRVTETVDGDQSCLRTDKPHWAQRLERHGYRTGYFGKWHVERSNRLSQYGWQVNGEYSGDLYKNKLAEVWGSARPDLDYSMAKYLQFPPGYADKSPMYGVTNVPPEMREMGITTGIALDFLDQASRQDAPWCCFVSYREPHDPFICGEAAYRQYDVEKVELPPHAYDDLSGCPNLYRKAARVWSGLTELDKKEAIACYYASITEIDQQIGRIMKKLEERDQLNRTIVVFTADHGELLGAHGLYLKNFSAFEEIYNIPLLVTGPGIAPGSTNARVGLHDLCPTLLELAGLEPIDTADSRSFAPVLRHPKEQEINYRQGFAEFYGGRIDITQRIVWKDNWKYVFNGFDFDELYHLEQDPYEMNNLIDHPAHQPVVREMCALMWKYVKETNDKSLYHSDYPILRIAPYGPLINEEREGETNV